jgi:3-deoxy-D-manno-octulosonic-acid transferase
MRRTPGLDREKKSVFGSPLLDRCVSLLADAVFGVFALFYSPIFMFKAAQAPSFRSLLKERLGIFPRAWREEFRSRKTVWLHAVSVGEVMAIRKFLLDFLELFPDTYVVLTTVTPTGQKIAKTLERERVRVCYFPFDFSFAVRKFYETFCPALLLLAETEIWPNTLLEGRRRGVRLGVINARLSMKSLKRYYAFGFLLIPFFKALDFVLTQSNEDMFRFRALGVLQEKVLAFGNMKFDNATFEAVETPERNLLKGEYGFAAGDRIWLAGSTHPGEEGELLNVFLRLRAAYPALKMILVPRHIERCGGIRGKVARLGLRAALAGERKPSEAFDVLILDQMGILKKLYAIAEAAFVGGSWVKHGGQNPIEPASLKCPILHGPHVFNFEKIYEGLDGASGAFLVHDAKGLETMLRKFLDRRDFRLETGQRAYDALVHWRGSTQRHLEWLRLNLGEILARESCPESARSFEKV